MLRILTTHSLRLPARPEEEDAVPGSPFVDDPVPGSCDVNVIDAAAPGPLFDPAAGTVAKSDSCCCPAMDSTC